jgi:hypothetical protein
MIRAQSDGARGNGGTGEIEEHRIIPVTAPLEYWCAYCRFTYTT